MARPSGPSHTMVRRRRRIIDDLVVAVEPTPVRATKVSTAQAVLASSPSAFHRSSARSWSSASFMLPSIAPSRPRCNLATTAPLCSSVRLWENRLRNVICRSRVGNRDFQRLTKRIDKVSNCFITRTSGIETKTVEIAVDALARVGPPSWAVVVRTYDHSGQ